LRNQIFGLSIEVEMDWRVLLTTFGVIFLAEMGDKTQIAAMTMAAQKKRPWEVFIGASLALVAVSAVGVLVGSVLGQYLPLDWIKRAAGAAFIVIGVLILIGKF
jgi:putative Ca2+/H+ antiporter (TMEM165/GDT1 family)